MGKYELVRPLAAGGMAEVFLAKAAGPMGFEKTLVVKRILPAMVEDPRFVEMFLSEAKLVAQLNHPNIVQIFDFGEADGAYFIAMEHIDGPNLRTLSSMAHAAGKPIPLPLCAKILSYACEGLAYAHDFADPETQQPLGLVHRDVSPDNIVLAKNGAVKVVDFGIAKAALLSPQTQTGFLKGKLAYMSPEYLRTKPVDRRADVFALGVVLYELVANKQPYDAASEVTLIHAMLFESMVPVRARRPDLPPELERIIERALAREREDRYPSCHELQADLERFVVSMGGPLSAVHIAQLVASLQGGGDGAPAAKAPSRHKPGSPSGEKRKAPPPPPDAEPGEGATVRMSVVDLPKDPRAVEEPNEATVRMSAADLQARVAARDSRDPAGATTPAGEARGGDTVRMKITELPKKSPPRTGPQPPAAPSSSAGPGAPPPPPQIDLTAEILKRLRAHARMVALATVGLLLVCVGTAFVAIRPSREPAPPPQPAETRRPEPPPAAEPPPEPAKPELPPPETRTATLKIAINAPAQVKIGKRQVPTSRPIELKPGKHSLDLVHPATGLWMKSLNVDLKPGEKRTLNVALEKGKLLFVSIPHATIYVDDDPRPVATTPHAGDFYEGKHRVRFECSQKPNPNIQEVTVEPGKELRVTARYQ